MCESLIDKYDKFKDFVFSASGWSAPTLVSVPEVRDTIAQFKLKGRKVINIRMIGLSYGHRREWIEEYAYNVLEQYEEDERQKRSNYVNIDLHMKYHRNTEIDEPLLIEFEDGDVLEIDTPQQPEFRISMNCIPWWINAGTNLPNVDANILFSPCIGQKIASVKVNTYHTDKDPMSNDYFDDEHSRRELVSDIILRFENGVGLRIGGWIDFCHVACIDNNDTVTEITFEKLKSSLFNWEDLHTDTTNGFEAESSDFFFGRIGADHTEEPFMTLIPGSKKSSLNISVNNFLLFGWSISHVERKRFDEYGEYDFHFNQWHDILDEAEKLLAFSSFDELFEYMRTIGITDRSQENVQLVQINIFGAEFWKHKDKYQKQLKDMREWTSITMTAHDTMRIFGF